MADSAVYHDLGWELDKPAGEEWKIGATYVVGAHHGDIWAKMVVTVTSKVWDDEKQDTKYGIEIETILDGTPGLLDGWGKGISDGD